MLTIVMICFRSGDVLDLLVLGLGTVVCTVLGCCLGASEYFV